MFIIIIIITLHVNANVVVIFIRAVIIDCSIGIVAPSFGVAVIIFVIIMNIINRTFCSYVQWRGRTIVIVGSRMRRGGG